MTFYLDFEANARTNEVISIGAISEDGHSFHSLVRPSTKLDRKIKELTGISQEEAEEAPTVDVAFSDFYKYLFRTSGVEDFRQHTFVVWGNHDKEFLSASAEFAEWVGTKAFIAGLCEMLTDIMPMVARKFNCKTISLRSAYLTMISDFTDPQELARKMSECEGSHNALNDSDMMRAVHQMFPTYQFGGEDTILKVKKPNMKYGKFDNYAHKGFDMPVHVEGDDAKHGHREWNFDHLYQALCLCPNIKQGTSKRKILERIVAAAKEGKPYCGKRFYIVG